MIKTNAAQDFYVKFSEATIEECNDQMDLLTSQTSEFTHTYNEEEATVLGSFFTQVPLNPGFGMSAPGVILFDKIVDVETKGVTLNITDIRTLQKLMLDCRPVTIVQMRAVKNSITLCNEMFVKLDTLEQYQRILAQIITKKNTEAATGLDYAKESNELEEQSLKVVKSELPEEAVAKEKAPKATKATKKNQKVAVK